MNYVTLGANNQNSSQNIINFANFNQINHTKTVLGCKWLYYLVISWALSTDFLRYSNLINSKIYL
jgi:hypothetical protein